MKTRTILSKEQQDFILAQKTVKYLRKPHSWLRDKLSSAEKFGVQNTPGPGAERTRLELSPNLSNWIYVKKKRLNKKTSQFRAREAKNT